MTCRGTDQSQEATIRTSCSESVGSRQIIHRTEAHLSCPVCSANDKTHNNYAHTNYTTFIHIAADQCMSLERSTRLLLAIMGFAPAARSMALSINYPYCTFVIISHSQEKRYNELRILQRILSVRTTTAQCQGGSVSLALGSFARAKFNVRYCVRE